LNCESRFSGFDKHWPFEYRHLKFNNLFFKLLNSQGPYEWE
jgi:hypothetical protein